MSGEVKTEKREDVLEWDYEKILKEREEQFNRRRVIRYLIQGVKYIYTYLREFPVEIIPNFMDNPASITIRVYWTRRDILEHMEDGTYIARLEKLEKLMKYIIREGLESKAPSFEAEREFEERLRVVKPEVYPQVPEAVEKHSANKPILSSNEGAGDVKALKRRRVVKRNAS